MKRLVFLLIASLCLINLGWAQSFDNLVATLSHEGQITTYYGYEALISAYGDAEDGDIITLSPGTFKACDINKGITLRGAGYVSDASKNQKQTILNNDFFIRDIDESKNLTLEGLLITGNIGYKSVKNVMFLRCFITNLLSEGEISNEMDYRKSQYNSMTFINCDIAGELCLNSYYCPSCTNNKVVSYNHVEIINSFVNNLNSFYNGRLDTTVSCNIQNSILRICPNGDLRNATISNSFLLWSATITGLQSSGNLLINSICIPIGATDVSDVERLIEGAGSTNIVINDVDEVFENYVADNFFDSDFHIKSTAKEQCTMSEGEVGIYGGAIPFTTIPTHPQITKFEVAPQSTSAGLLPVKIKVGND